MTKNQLDALYRVALSEFFTAPTTPADYDVRATLAKLQRADLVRWDNGYRLTDLGRDAMDHELFGGKVTSELDDERVGQLTRLRETRAKFRGAS